MTTAVVVGSGPNGLAAAITLAQHGVAVRVLEAKESVGGGTRSSQRTLPGVVHDDCSAFHPMGAASPFFQSLHLDEHGLRWAWPEVELAHPLDDGRAGVMWRDLDRTREGLGSDGRRWARLVGPVSRHVDALMVDVMRPVLHVPRHPVALAQFGLRAAAPAALTARLFRTEEAQALFGGIAAHLVSSLRMPLSGAVGLLLAAVGHSYGWPVAAGGSGSIATALVAKLQSLGGTVETGMEVTSLDQVGDADIVVLDVTPHAAARIVGDRLPARVARAYRRYRYGPAAFKVDFAVRGDVPWENEHVRRAGTVHLGGTLEEIVAAEGRVARGSMPDAPFVLVGQQYVADPARSADGVNPVWCYAHVPHGYRGDATEAIVSRIEHYAPGFRDRIVEVATRDAAEMQTYNPNYVGGDIGAGSNAGLRLLFRPRVSVRPYSTKVPGVYLCSASTPPGAGVHGMGGHHAARSALRDLRR